MNEPVYPTDAVTEPVTTNPFDRSNPPEIYEAVAAVVAYEAEITPTIADPVPWKNDAVNGTFIVTRELSAWITDAVTLVVPLNNVTKPEAPSPVNPPPVAPADRAYEAVNGTNVMLVAADEVNAYEAEPNKLPVKEPV